MTGKYSQVGEAALWVAISDRCSSQLYNLEGLQSSLRSLPRVANNLAQLIDWATEDASIRALVPSAKEIEELVLAEFRGEQPAGTARSFLEARHAALLAKRPTSLPSH